MNSGILSLECGWNDLIRKTSSCVTKNKINQVRKKNHLKELKSEEKIKIEAHEKRERNVIIGMKINEDEI